MEITEREKGFEQEIVVHLHFYVFLFVMRNINNEIKKKEREREREWREFSRRLAYSPMLRISRCYVYLSLKP